MDQRFWILSGRVKVVNYTAQPIRITPRELVVDGRLVSPQFYFPRPQDSTRAQAANDRSARQPTGRLHAQSSVPQ